MYDNTCHDCLNPGNGKCSKCDGTGCAQDCYEGEIDAFGIICEACGVCGGTGECQSCKGKGYL